MNLKSGDKIKFGVIYCNKTGRRNLMNKTIMLTPQSFEYDNGLYTEDQECPGIYSETEGEPESIYHLFGNKLEEFYDCLLIKATDEDFKKIVDIRKIENDQICKELGDMASFLRKN